MKIYENITALTGKTPLVRLEKYEKSGYVIHKNGNYAFTKKGFFVSNYILSDILENI